MIITTENSRYELDLENQLVTRLPMEHAGTLRRDEESVKLLKLYGEPTVGEDLVMLLDIRRDGIETLRRTSPIVHVEV
jgi:hypothetical protein